MNEMIQDSSVDLFRKKYGLEVIDNLLAYDFIKNQNTSVPYLFAKNHSVLPLAYQDGFLLVAMLNPLQIDILEELRCMTSLEVKEVLTTQKALSEAIEFCYRNKEGATSELMASLQTKAKENDTDDEGYDLLEDVSDSAVIKILNAIFKEAVTQGASDIHFEPMEQGIGVRYRIDGVLQPRHAPPKEYQSQLITRIKVMSCLDIAEQRLPQDGRMKLRLGGRHIDFRVSTVPCVYGERIVLRILDKSNISLGLNKIGMRKETLETFEKLISLSEGIVLVTGPTGSGKTTTLYSALSKINSSEVNVMTIEDPVEYKLQGMAQIGVNPKISLNFSTGLRHILRQDPDVIMIGEIRDRETAEISIQAALTGHLVLSTLHTNDAPSALTRLVDMGIEPYLLTSSIVAVLAQRLVRTICPHCKVPCAPSPRELQDMQLKACELEEGFFYHGLGCEMCFGSGYKGRHGIYELMVMNGEIKQQLLQSADARQLQLVAQKMGLSTLRQEGAFLVKKGITTPAEVVRATRGCEEGS
jgi:general secretion pathway protein E